jgi:hypothetical protein
MLLNSPIFSLQVKSSQFFLIKFIAHCSVICVIIDVGKIDPSTGNIGTIKVTVDWRYMKDAALLKDENGLSSKNPDEMSGFTNDPVYERNKLMATHRIAQGAEGERVSFVNLT